MTNLRISGSGQEFDRAPISCGFPPKELLHTVKDLGLGPHERVLFVAELATGSFAVEHPPVRFDLLSSSSSIVFGQIRP